MYVLDYNIFFSHPPLVRGPCRPLPCKGRPFFLGSLLLYSFLFLFRFLCVCVCVCSPAASVTYLNFTRAYTGKDKRDLYPLMPVICSIKLLYATDTLPADLTLAYFPRSPRFHCLFSYFSFGNNNGKRSLNLPNGKRLRNITTYGFILSPCLNTAP